MANYCTLDEVKAELDITSEDKDDLLQSSIEQTKKFIDNLCDRRFDTIAETRYFDGSASPLHIDDLVSISGGSDGIWLDEDADDTYEGVMASTDYIFYPLNAMPKTSVRLSNNSAFGGFASGVTKGVKIVATWGYDTSIPEPIKRASIIQVCRWFKRRESAFQDAMGSPEIGQLIVYKGLDADVAQIIKGYHKLSYP